MAIAAPASSSAVERWRHKKRGTVYEVIGRAEVQVSDCILEGHHVVVYRATDGTLWVRPTDEFYDGRFEKISDAAPAPSSAGAREWLVIEDSRKNAVFAPDEARDRKGYIPRDVAEQLLGRDLGGNQWFSREDSEKMRAHPEWRDTLPEGA